MEMNLREKTELYVCDIKLANANLDAIAHTAATELGIAPERVIVVDVRDDTVTLDILQDTVRLEDILGREESLLKALSQIEGVTIVPKTRIHSEGVLGMVALDQETAELLPERLKKIERTIDEKISKRAIVFPTGREIIDGEIADTNTPFLKKVLSEAGYEAVEGPAIDDDPDIVIQALGAAADNGFGLVITTGGTGAEDKDFLVEGVTVLDPHAATPYIVHYPVGQGRHKKDGVRIAVGEMGWTTFVALTGPNPEVKLASPVLLRGLAEKWDKARMADEIAATLRTILPVRSHS